jgi:predicted RNA-binding protein YlxR (DUF448 family)
MRIPHNEPLDSGSLEAHPAESDLPERLSAPGSAKPEPERKCILTGRNGARDELIRLAISPEGPDGISQVLPDVLARAPGRGAWIGVSRAELEIAIGAGKGGGKLKGALARAFKGAALSIPEDLGAKIEAALLRALTDRLGLEMRTGFLMLGSERIAEKARSGKVAWLGHAADSSVDGARKLDQAWRVGEDAEGSGKAGMRLPLDRAALSVALGRENVVHLALTNALAAQRIDGLLLRLVHFLGRGETNEFEHGERTADSAAPDAVTAD